MQCDLYGPSALRGHLQSVREMSYRRRQGRKPEILSDMAGGEAKHKGCAWVWILPVNPMGFEAAGKLPTVASASTGRGRGREGWGGGFERQGEAG